MQNNSINRYGNPNATQGLFLEGNYMAARTFRKKKQQQSRVFLGVIFYVYTNVTWITKKEPQRVIENKGDEFRRKKNTEIQSGGEKC